MKGLLVLAATVAFNIVFATLWLPDRVIGGVLALWIMWCVLSGVVAGYVGAEWENRS